MKVVGIIQARMGSTRLPGKMLMEIAGRPTIAHVVSRLQQAKQITGIGIATTIASADDVIALWAKAHNIACYRGSEKDVLDRYYQAATLWDADVIVRITGDCPLLDPSVVDTVIAAYLAGSYDYVSNTIDPTYPDGLDTEVCSFDALQRAWQQARLPSEREHVTPYIWKHPELFRLKNVSNQVNLSVHRWTLDTPDDLAFLRQVISACESTGDCSLNSVLAILLRHPQWSALNSHHSRNEGYKKSLQDEQK